MNKSKAYMIGIFALMLVLFAIFTTKIHFHDSLEYINLAKSLAGIQNINIFSSHSSLYPFLMSFLLKIWPSMTAIRIMNVFWVFLIAVVLLFYLKNTKAFLIFAFSPLSWYMSIQTTPALPAAFFFLLTCIFLSKKEIKFHLWLSGLFLGLAFAFYDPILIFAIFFVLIFFWDKSFLDVAKYGLAFVIGIIPILALNYYLFANPIFSFIKFWGVNFVMSMNMHPYYSAVSLLPNLAMLSIIFVISPFLFRIYKLDMTRSKRILMFLAIISLILIFRVPNIKYFIILSPIIIILLSGVLSNREIKWHCILSIIILIFMVKGFFIEDVIVNSDLQKIKQDYNEKYIIGGPLEAARLAAFSWDNKPYFVYYDDFEASLNNETFFRQYAFNFDSNIMPFNEKFQIIGSFSRYENKTYKDYIIVASNNKEIPGKTPDKCYEELCVYNK